jgi:thiamine-monophosphate kinase
VTGASPGGRGKDQGGARGRGEDLAGLGEFGLISRLTRAVPAGDGVEVGVGDDGAVLAVTPGRRLVATTDVLVEGRHFDAAYADAPDWGWKSVAVNVSDLAAMGAVPRWLLLAVTVPPGRPVAVLDGLYAGVAEACDALRIGVVGGDVSSGPVLSLAVTALGEVDRYVTRGGARPGDRLVVTGPIGAAGAGLGLLRRAAGGDDAAAGLLARHPGLAAAHRRPWPDVAAGLRLARLGANAMLDVSDGLAGDALHLAEDSGIGVEIHDAALPLAPGVAEAAAHLGCDPAQLALGGGDDYVLAAAVPRAVEVGGVIDVGSFVADPARRVHVARGVASPLAGVSWDHFRDHFRTGDPGA